MKKLILFFLLTSSTLPAGVLLTFNPPGGGLQGAPGQTVTWNFHLSNDANYLLIDQVDYLTLSPVGTFTDLFSGVAPVIGPGDSVDGTSSYTIDPPAAIGFASTGQLEITYDEFLTNPNDPGFDFNRDHVNTDPETVSALASVTVVAPAAVPEPATLSLLLLGGAAAMLARRRAVRR